MDGALSQSAIVAQGRIALALDLDGVVIESNDAKSDAFVAVFAACWPDWEGTVRRYNRAHFGVPRREKMRHLLRQIAPDQCDDALLAELLDDYGRRLHGALAAFPLVGGVATVIGSGQFDIFICSSAPQSEIRIVLDHHGLTQMVHRIFDGTSPKSDALAQIARDYPGRCLFVGDSAADMRAAAAAGTPFVLRISGPEAEALNASTVIQDFDGFGAVVTKMLG